MEIRHLSIADVEALISEPEATQIGELVFVYDGVVRGIRLRVVVARDSDPLRVVTVMRRRR
jgi:Domain of unknown function (DUF4258)